ncbi:nucleotidyltransferase family protein [Deinococcus arenicola]|uniref:Nucleotidyltransferase family protein n=1 Tax=Deinococcus arenicola TaxID=2994950 RepID=A0ABU4DS40_9DEIO|nr:nucleotidyltransferase family protein [Deinococcus sp. ZS9-10]MDV6374909.1 nucleotidyltransferase family protein [Deinococcus sp. ZS9-10]
MNETEFLRLVRLNPVNAAILDRLPELGVQQGYLVAGALFCTVWNVQSGQPPTAQIRDYDLFYWDDDLSYAAEDAVIRRAERLFADLNVKVEVRNQARVHLWFGQKFGLERPALGSVQEGIDQFLVTCTCVGVDAQGVVYAPYGLDDLQTGVLRSNPRNHTPGLCAAKIADYVRRWPWLRPAGGEGS